ncbi:MAG: 4-diphosphocytidyl-2-C-methyl-D-erythritol kinase [Gemmatimonadetes bacterium]|jgi:4-diphosphocytidyl-2-C-methyl-D-erythritol kinase|nr:4-diphosphocytidyl-2-C-methyl-D-erythritol kinase [Gemmatimonadota bacterium]
MSLDALRGASSAQVAAQAKVNLRLRILAREASGYHGLETLFLRLALADAVRIRVTNGPRSLDVDVDVDGGELRTSLGPVERNLAWRAASAYAEEAGWPNGFAIELEKRIPVGGGLGGGSADAGAVLRLLDALAPAALPEARLRALAAGLGADVPFLATGHAFALAWGRGERLLPLPPPPQRAVVLVVPAFAVSTADAYGWLAVSRGGVAAGAESCVLDLASLSDWRGLEALATNDFEPVVAARHPEVAIIVEALRGAGCRPALMSGSGSVVFGVLPELAGGADAFVPDPAPGARLIRTATASTTAPVEAWHS